MSKLYKLLLAENEPAIRDMLMQNLAHSEVKDVINLKIKECVNGAEAWEHISSEGADIVLTDINMPKMDGFELTRKIKGLNPEIMVIVMTGFTTSDQLQEARAAGADHTLGKPFPIVSLIEILKNFLERQ